MATLSEEHRARLDEIVSDMEQNGEAPENIQFVVDDFSSKYGAPTSQSYGSSLVGSGARGFVGTGVGGLIEGVGDVASIVPGLGDNTLQRAGQSVKDFSTRTFPVNPGFEEDFGVKAAGAVGQAAEMMAEIPLTGGVGRVVGGARMAMPVARGMSLGGGFARGADIGEDVAAASGITDPVKRAAMILGYGAAEGGIEALGGAGTKQFTSNLLGEMASFSGSPLRRFGKTAISEGAEEVLTGEVQDTLTKTLAEEDPNRPGFTIGGAPLPPPFFSEENLKNRLEEFALGSIGGAVFGGVQEIAADSSVRRGLALRDAAKARITELEDISERTPEQDAELDDLIAQDQTISQSIQGKGLPTEVQDQLLDQSSAYEETFDDEIQSIKSQLQSELDAQDLEIISATEPFIAQAESNPDTQATAQAAAEAQNELLDASTQGVLEDAQEQTQTLIDNAAQQIQQQPGLPTQREGGDQGGETTETGRGGGVLGQTGGTEEGQVTDVQGTLIDQGAGGITPIDASQAAVQEPLAQGTVPQGGASVAGQAPVVEGRTPVAPSIPSRPAPVAGAAQRAVQSLGEWADERVNFRSNLASGPRNTMWQKKFEEFRDEITPLIQQYEGVFSDIQLIEGIGGGGVRVGELTGTLQIDPKTLFNNLSIANNAEQAKGIFSKMLDEEFRHSVTLELDRTSPKFAQDLQNLWETLPEDVQNLSAETYFKETGSRYQSEWQAKHEFFRQYWQNAEIRDITENALREKGVIDRLYDLIDSFIEALRKLQQGAVPEVKPILDRLIAQAQERADEIKKQASETQKAAKEPAKSSPKKAELEDSTSLKRAVVDEERAARGAEAIPTPKSKGWSESEQEAAQQLRDDPRAGKNLLESIKVNVRPLTQTENALLLFYKVEVANDLEQAAKRVAEAQATGDQGKVDEAMAAYNDVASIYNDIDIYSRMVGTESGRSLNARKMAKKLEKKDVSLAALTQKYRTEAKDGEALTKEEIATVKKHADELTAALDKVESMTEEEQKVAAQPVEKKLEQEARAEDKEARESIKTARKKTFKDLGASARERLKERKGKGLSAPSVGSGPLDAEYMAAVEAGDMAKAQKMVDEAAKAAGFTDKVFHGTKNKEFDTFKPTIGANAWYGEGVYTTRSRQGAQWYAGKDGRIIEGWAKAQNPKQISSADELNSVQAKKFTDDAKRDGFDSIEVTGRDETANELILFDTSQIKSSEPVTRDDQGNVIPLSQRFNPEESRFLYSPEKSKADQDFEDYAIVGAEYIEDGAKSLDAFTEKMTGEFGSGIQDQIEPLYNRAKEIHAQALATLQKEQAKAKEAATPKAVLEAGKKSLEGKPNDKIDRDLAVKLFKAHVRARSSLTPEQVNSAVTENLKEIYPNITESDVRVAITDYGKAKWPSKDALKQREAEYRRILRLIESLERIQGGQQALKSGLQRSKPSPRERELTAQIKEAMKKFKVETTAENQLATTKKAITNRLKNQIEDLNRIISGTAKPKTPREQVKYDAEMNALVKERNELQAYVDDLTGPSPEGKWNQKARAAAKASAEYYRRKIERKEFAARSKPGYQPDETTRKLQEEAKAAKAEFQNLKDLSGETQKEQLAAQKKRLESEIEKVRERLITGEKPPAGKPKATDAEIQSLKETLKNLRESVRLVEGTSRQSDAQKAENARKMLERSIDRMEKEIARREQDNRTLPKEKKEQPDSPELRALRERRDVLKETIDALKEAESPRRLAEEIARDNFKRRIERLQYEAKNMTKKQEFLDLPDDTRAKDLKERASKAKYELEQAKKSWNNELLNKKLAARSGARKVFDRGVEVLNLSRSILTSLDLSAVLRQGGFLALANPKRMAEAFGPMLKSFVSDKARYDAMEKIKNDPDFAAAQRAKLFLSDINDADLSKMEEAFFSRWVDKIPGWAGGGLLRGSQRAYTTFLNMLRFSQFKAMKRALERDGKITLDEGKALANFINVASGRGVIGLSDKQQANPALATVFFSPRLVSSRFNLLFGQPLYGGTMRTRKLVAMEYAKFLAGVAAAMGLATLMRDPEDEEKFIETDPRSADFLKARFGDSRLDLFGGLLQATVLMSRLVTGETKTLAGEEVALRDSLRPLELLRELQGESQLGDKPQMGADTLSVLGRFLRSKLSPVAGSMANMMVGEDYLGKPTSVQNEAAKMLVPMSFGSILDAMEEQGVPRGTALSLLSLFGAGLQTYKPRED